MLSLNSTRDLAVIITYVEHLNINKDTIKVKMCETFQCFSSFLLHNYFY